MIPKFRAYINKRIGVIWVKRICFYPPFIDFEWENEIGITQTYSEDLDKVKLMQSTGLKDKNGTEIFAGDITKLDEGDTYHLCVVEFNNDELCYQLTNRKTIGEYIGELVFVRGKHMAECEVVGNIHENRELLEVPNEL